jgi:uncharacterized membrane protein YebE (DUF533 family)
MSLSFLGPLFGAAMGARRKPYDNAASFLFGGGSPFHGARGMLGLAGLAAAAYYALRQDPGASMRGSPPIVDPGTTVVRGGPSLPQTPPPMPPPMPPPPAQVVGSPGVQRLLRLVISAARCDGAIGEQERAAILAEAREIGAEATVESELARPLPLAQIVAGVVDPSEKEALYVLAYTIVRADTDVNGAERVFLVQLANLLGLDAARIRAIEQDVAARIAAAG